MNKLTNLIADIKKEQKMTTDELLTSLADALENEEKAGKTYKELYVKAFGNKLTESTCRAWVTSLPEGQKWTVEQTSDIASRIGANWDVMTKYEFWALMNAFWYDYQRTAEKYELKDEAEFYGDIVWDTFNDADSNGCKTPMNYYLHFVI